MATIDLNGFVFNVVPCDALAYRKVLISLIKASDKPLERFCARLGNLHRDDRAAAIKGFMARPDWDEPTEEQIKAFSESDEGWVWTAWMTFKPQLSIDKLDEIIGDDLPKVKEAIKKAYKELEPPTDEEILEMNAKIKEKLWPTQ